jgi:predicted dehydrogenase
LCFSSGAIGSLHLDYLQQPGKHTLNIIGSEGSLEWDNADGVLHVYSDKNKTREIFKPADGFERNTMFVDEMRHFVSVARGESDPFCTLDDGLQALRLALAAMESCRESKMQKDLSYPRLIP